jgi:hypothetical protein
MRGIAAGRHAADAHGLLAFLDLDLGDARFLEQLDQLLDLANIHGPLPKAWSSAARSFSCGRASLERRARGRGATASS